MMMARWIRLAGIITGLVDDGSHEFLLFRLHTPLYDAVAVALDFAFFRCSLPSLSLSLFFFLFF